MEKFTTLKMTYQQVNPKHPNAGPYRDFVQSHLEGVIFFPKNVCRLGRNANRSLVDLTEGIHFLLILPIATSDVSRARFNKLNVI